MLQLITRNTAVQPNPACARPRAHRGTSELAEHGGTKEITYRRTAHEGLKVPPNAPDGLVAFIKPLV